MQKYTENDPVPFNRRVNLSQVTSHYPLFLFAPVAMDFLEDSASDPTSAIDEYLALIERLNGEL